MEEHGPAIAPYTLFFIEVDDQGIFWKRSDVDLALNRIRRLVLDANEGSLMLTFVHGWQNNAAPDNGNVQTFRETLQELSLMEASIAQIEARKPRQIVGTYIGWRGKTLEVPSPLHFPTFWDRKATAEVVGHRSAEVFDRLEAIWAERRGELESDRLAPTRLITLGHSFGADVVANALGHRLVRGLSVYKEALEAGPKAANSGRPISRVFGYGDLVVLINPAFEALQLAPARDLIADIGSFPSAQRPVLAVLTSDSDDATGFWFHAGRQYRNLTRSYQSRTGDPVDLDERSADQTGLGHEESFLTMSLKIGPHPVTGDDEAKSFQAWTHGSNTLLISRPLRDDDSSCATTSLHFSDLGSPGRAPSPFLNVAVAKEVFSGHSLPTVSVPGHPGVEFNRLEDAIAGLVRLADYPVEGGNQDKRNNAIQAMSVQRRVSLK